MDTSGALSRLWVGSVNFGYVQDAPQAWRDGATAYCRGEFVALFWRWAWGLFAAELVQPLADRLGLLWRRRRGCAGALQRGMDVGGFHVCVGRGVLLGHVRDEVRMKLLMELSSGIYIQVVMVSAG
jgi:hypothetical protein